MMKRCTKKWHFFEHSTKSQYIYVDEGHADERRTYFSRESLRIEDEISKLSETREKSFWPNLVKVSENQIKLSWRNCFFVLQDECFSKTFRLKSTNQMYSSMPNSVTEVKIIVAARTSYVDHRVIRGPLRNYYGHSRWRFGHWMKRKTLVMAKWQGKTKLIEKEKVGQLCPSAETRAIRTGLWSNAVY